MPDYDTVNHNGWFFLDIEEEALNLASQSASLVTDGFARDEYLYAPRTSASGMGSRRHGGRERGDMGNLNDSRMAK